MGEELGFIEREVVILALQRLFNNTVVAVKTLYFWDEWFALPNFFSTGHAKQ